MFYVVKIRGSRFYRYSLPTDPWYTADIWLDGSRAGYGETLEFFCQSRVEAEACLDAQMGKLYKLLTRGRKNLPFRGKRRFDLEPVSLKGNTLSGVLEYHHGAECFLGCYYHAEIVEHHGELVGDPGQGWPDLEAMYVTKR